MIGRELKRILQKPAALVCIVVYIGIMILGVETDLRAGYETGIFDLFFLTENYGVTAFVQTLIFPIVAAGNYFDERKGHYDWLMQMRSGQRRYCIAKIVSAVLGGIILYMISVLLFFALCVVFVPGVRQGGTVESIKLLFGGTLSGDIEPFWYKMALVFISDWYLCIDWIVRFCILHKSICILYAAISSYKNWRLYWRLYDVVVIYTVWNGTYC